MSIFDRDNLRPGGPWATHVTTTWSRSRQQPGWLMRAVVVAFLLVVLLPFLLLLFLAILIAALVFAMLSAVNRLLRLARGLGPRNDGRENVRVVKRVTER